MVKGVSQSVLWSTVCMSLLILWSKVCRSQCYGKKYVTVNVMVKVCHSQCCGIKYVTDKCHGQKYVCHS